LTPRHETSAEAFFCFAPRGSRVSGRPDSGAFATPILNGMLRASNVSDGVPSGVSIAVPTPEVQAQRNDAASPHRRHGGGHKSSGEHRTEPRAHKHGHSHPPPWRRRLKSLGCHWSNTTSVQKLSEFSIMHNAQLKAPAPT